MTLSIEILTNAGSNDRAGVQQQLATDWRANGIEVTSVVLPFNIVVPKLFNRSFDGLILGVVPGLFDPIGPGVFSTNARTLPLWSNGNPFEPFESDLNALVASMQTELDPARRLQAIRDAQDLIGANQPLDFTVTPILTNFALDRVRNTTQPGLWSGLFGMGVGTYLEGVIWLADDD